MKPWLPFFHIASPDPVPGSRVSLTRGHGDVRSERGYRRIIGRNHRGGSRWITDAGEILAVARNSRAAGERDYAVFGNPEAFRAWANSLRSDTNLLVLKDYQLNIRGPVAQVKPQIPSESDVEWLMIVKGSGYQGRDESWECWGTAEILERLEDYHDEYVTIGRMPAWNPAVVPHAPDTLSAIVPRADGSTQRGIY